MEIGFLVMQIFYVSKMATNGGCHFEAYMCTIMFIQNKIIKQYSIFFLKLMHTHTHLTHVICVYLYANNHFVGLFYESCTFISHLILGKKSICECDITTSLICWFPAWHSKFSIINKFLVYHPIYMKFVPNSLVL